MQNINFKKLLFNTVGIGTLFAVICMVSYQIEQAKISKMAGQMILVGFRGTGTGLYESDVQLVEQEIKRGHVGGIILFDKDVTSDYGPRNVENTGQVAALNKRLQNAAPIPLFVAIDQEGGMVNRLKKEHGFATTPSAKSLGHGTSENTYNVANDLGTRLAGLGFNVDFAPSVDLDINQNNPIIGGKERAFSADQKTVIAHADAFAQGLKNAGIIYSYKHFPGHGSSTGDTHHGVVDVTKTWSDTELAPYRTLVNSNMPGMVMVAHVTNKNIDENYPASLSKKTIGGILRDELKYDGVVITDDLQMGAIVAEYGAEEVIRLAIDAGVDVLLMGNNMTYDANIASKTHAILMKMVKDGTLSKMRLQKSYQRIMNLKKSAEIVK